MKNIRNKITTACFSLLFLASTGKAQYCTSQSAVDNFETGITLVQFAGINNNTSSIPNQTYTDFTSLSASVTQGNSFNITVELDPDVANSGVSASATVWIDWDQDGNFNSTSEQYLLGSRATSVGPTDLSPVTITVPASALPGNTRMRVIALYNATPTDPCATGFDGEVEDYTVNVGGVAAPQTLSASNASLSSNTITFQASVNGDDVVIARNTANSFVDPTNGQNYTVGNTLGGATIIYNGSDNSSPFSDNALNADVTYYYQAWSVNASNEYSAPTPSASATTQTSVSSNASSLMIAEVGAQNNGNKDEGYVKIYNRTGGSVTLNNFSIESDLGGAGPITLTGTLANGATHSVTHVDFSGFTGNQTANNKSLQMRNTGTTITLSEGGVVVDRVVTSANNTFNQKRNATVCQPNTTYTASEWTTISSVGTAGAHSTTGCTTPLAEVSTANGSWDTPSNWASGTVPGATDDVVIDGAITITGIDNYKVVEQLVINTGASLTIDTRAALTVNNGITNNGTITVNNGASLVQGTVGSNNGSGAYNVIRTTDQIVSNAIFNYWSSPIQNAALTSVFPNSNPVDFYTFTSGSWNTATGTMTSGLGYTATGDASATYPTSFTRTFAGNPVNNGTINVPYNGGANGFILLGNPYPSAINVTAFNNANDQMEGTAYLWDQNTGTSNDYATTNGSGGTSGGNGKTPNGFIPAAQAFFMQATGNPPANVTFTNGQRTVGNNNQFFSPGQNTMNRVWLMLQNDSAGYNQLLVALNDDATDGFDKNLDGKKMKGNPQLSFYSKIDQEDYAIQALPKPNYVRGKTIALGVDAYVSGEYTIALDSLDNWPENYSLTLIDRLNHAEINLLTEGAHHFTVDSTGVIANRFFLNIEHKLEASNGELNDDSDTTQTTSVDDKNIELHDIDVFQAQGKIWVNATHTPFNIQHVELMNVNGQLLGMQRFGPQNNRVSVSTGNLAQGIYLVKVTTTNGENMNRKIFIK